MYDLEQTQRDIVRLITAALDAASTPEELLDCARAAAGTNDLDLMRAVAERISAEVQETVDSASSWSVQATFSKIEAWRSTGLKATVLAEAWSFVGPPVIAAS